MAALALDQLRKERDEFLRGAHERRLDHRAGREREDDRREIVGPLLEARAVLGIGAEHRRDHERRDRPRERLVELDAVAVERRDRALDDLAHVLLERGDRRAA